MDRIKAIALSFLATVGPAAVLFVTVMVASPVVQAADCIFFPLAIVSVLLNVPIGIVGVFALHGGSVCVGIVSSNLAVFNVGGTTYTADTNPALTASAKTGFVISLIMFLLLIPISIFIWLIRCVVILANKRYAERVCEEVGKVFRKLLIMVVVCIVGLSVSCINLGLLALQDAKYAVDNFEFSFAELSCIGKEWVGLSNESYTYDLKYTFQNNSKFEGGIRGDIIIENKEGVKIELGDKNITVYAPPMYQRDFEKHEVRYYFYVSIKEKKINDMLQSNLNDIKIHLEIEEANWGKNRVREYKQAKVIMLKDFGAHTNEKLTEGQGESTNETKYQNAIIKYNQGDYEEAKAIFASLGNYKQSIDYVEMCYDKIFYKNMEQSLITVAGKDAILPDDYVIHTAYSENYYVYYEGDYYSSFYADFYINSAEMEEYINSFIIKLINNGYSCIDEGTYKKGNTIIQFGYFYGDDYFTYYAFKI